MADNDNVISMTPKQDKGTLTMVLLHSGIFLIGILIGGNKLTNPRVFSIEDSQHDGKPTKLMRMEPLPGIPDFIRIHDEASYPIPGAATQIIALYEQVTTNPNVKMN